MGAVGWEVPLIMHCFCFSFADLSAADLSKSPCLQWRNLGSSHGISHGMIIWPFSSCVSYWFLLQGYTWQNWVSAPSQINNKGLCLCQLLDERLLSSCIAFHFLFQTNKLKNWVSLLPRTKWIWGFQWDDKLYHLTIHCFPLPFWQTNGNQHWVSCNQ